MVRTVTEIPATAGPPYFVDTRGKLIRLRREAGGREVFVLFSPGDALRVADALVDVAEQ